MMTGVIVAVLAFNPKQAKSFSPDSEESGRLFRLNNCEQLKEGKEK